MSFLPAPSSAVNNKICGERSVEAFVFRAIFVQYLILMKERLEITAKVADRKPAQEVYEAL